jgi:hypothetical protein
MIEITSRFITAPDIVEKENNHTVVIVDASQQEIEDIALFCKVGKMFYDVYLFRSDEDDNKWLNSILTNADFVLNSVDSPLSQSINSTTFGQGGKYKVPLNYFQEYENAAKTEEVTIG